MQAQSVSVLAYGALAVLVSWRIYARFRRSVGRQRLTKHRAPITLVVYGLILLAVVGTVLNAPLLLGELAAFSIAGAALASFALSRTRFDASAEGFFYTPYSPIAISLAVLFVARILYRVIEIFFLRPDLARGPGEFVASPLTLAAFGLLAGYYVWYSAGLARWRRRVLKARRTREEAERDP